MCYILGGVVEDSVHALGRSTLLQFSSSSVPRLPKSKSRHPPDCRARSPREVAAGSDEGDGPVQHGGGWLDPMVSV